MHIFTASSSAVAIAIAQCLFGVDAVDSCERLDAHHFVVTTVEAHA